MYYNFGGNIMNKDTTIILRINSDLKRNVTEIARREDVTLSQLITASLVSICHDNRIPYSLLKYLPLKHGEEKVLSISQIKKITLKLLEEYHVDDVSKVYLFGSYARGDATPRSNIDMRVEMDRECDSPSGLNFFTFHSYLEEALRKEVNLVSRDLKDLDKDFADTIKREQICIIER